MDEERLSIPSSLPAHVKPLYQLDRLRKFDERWILQRLRSVSNPALRKVAIDILHLCQPRLLRGSQFHFRTRMDSLLDNPATVLEPTSDLGSGLLRSLASNQRILRIVNQLADIHLSALVLENRGELLDSLYASRWDLRLLRPLQGDIGLDGLAGFLLEHVGLLVDARRGLTAQHTLILPVLYCCIYFTAMAGILGPIGLVSWKVWVPMLLFYVVYLLARSEYENEKAMALFISFTDEFLESETGDWR
jgi:hypothetical protein